MEQRYVGAFPSGVWHYKGPLAEIRAVNGPDGAIGHPTDRRVEMRYRNGQWEAMENSLVNLDTGAETFPASLRTLVRGQSVRSDGNLFLLGPNRQFTGSAETDCFTAPVAGTADGAYTGDPSDEGMPPIIRGGFLIPSGAEKAQGLRLKASCGINFLAATANSSTLAMKMTLSWYFINMVTGVRAKFAAINILAAQIASAAPATFVPCDFVGTIAPATQVSGPTWSTRNHDYQLVASGGYGANVAGFKEQFPYPEVDWSVDQGIIATIQQDSGWPLGTYFMNQVSLERE